MKLSFCTTCRDRLWQREAYLVSLCVAVEWHETEFVLVDYGSKESVRNFVEDLPKTLRKMVTYYRYEADRFHMSHAKNLAHRLATGEVLVNLDFDNFLTPASRNILLYGVEEGRVLQNMTPHFPGTGGRIAVTRGDFHKLRGYDESFEPYGHEDWDFLERAKRANLKVRVITYGSSSIENDRSSPQLQRWCETNRRIMARVNRAINPDGYGRGKVQTLGGEIITVE